MNSRIKLLRNYLKKTQQEFGSDCGKSRDAIANYETGRVVPDTAFLKLLCLKFNVNEHWLRTGEGEMFSKTLDDMIGDLAEKYDLDKYDISIIRHYVELSAEDRKKFTSLMKIIFFFFYDITEKSDEHLSVDERLALIRPQLEAAEKGKTSTASTSINSPAKENNA